MDLLCLAVKRDRQGEHALLSVPILIVPLTDGLFEDGKHVEFKGPLEDRTGIPQGLIFDTRRQERNEVLGAEGVIMRDKISIQGT
jgi:hypothetical protein